GAVLADERANFPAIDAETDVAQRFDAGKGLGDPLEAKSGLFVGVDIRPARTAPRKLLRTLAAQRLDAAESLDDPRMASSGDASACPLIAASRRNRARSGLSPAAAIAFRHPARRCVPSPARPRACRFPGRVARPE